MIDSDIHKRLGKSQTYDHRSMHRYQYLFYKPYFIILEKLKKMMHIRTGIIEGLSSGDGAENECEMRPGSRETWIQIWPVSYMAQPTIQGRVKIWGLFATRKFSAFKNKLSAY